MALEWGSGERGPDGGGGSGCRPSSRPPPWRPPHLRVPRVARQEVLALGALPALRVSRRGARRRPLGRALAALHALLPAAGDCPPACGATNHERARLPLRSAGRGPKLTQSSRIAKPASTGDHEPLLAPRAAAPPPSPPRPSRMRALQNGYWAVAPVLATCQPVCSRCHRHPVSKLWGHSGSRGAASWAPPCQRAWLRPFTHISCRVRRTAGCAGWKQSVDGQQIAEGRAMRQECVGVPERGGYRAGRAGRGRWKARMGLRPHTYRARERELRARRASG